MQEEARQRKEEKNLFSLFPHPRRPPRWSFSHLRTLPPSLRNLSARLLSAGLTTLYVRWVGDDDGLLTPPPLLLSQRTQSEGLPSPSFPAPPMSTSDDPSLLSSQDASPPSEKEDEGKKACCGLETAKGEKPRRLCLRTKTVLLFGLQRRATF